MKQVLLPLLLVFRCGSDDTNSNSNADSDSDSDSDSDTTTTTTTTSDTESGTSTDTYTGTGTGTGSDTDTESGCLLTEPDSCDDSKLDSNVGGDPAKGSFYDNVDFCVPADDDCAAERVAAWAPDVECGGEYEGRATCAPGEMECGWNIGTIDADEWDALCDLTSIEGIETIYLTVWL